MLYSYITIYFLAVLSVAAVAERCCYLANERNNLAQKNPEKLKELQEVFDQEAKKYNVYPFLGFKQVEERLKERPNNILFLQKK